MVLGATGMLGHALFFALNRVPGYQVWGTVRKIPAGPGLPPFLQEAGQAGRLIAEVDAYDFPSVASALESVKPQVVINCIGLIRHLAHGQQIWPCLEINARLPHLLLHYCQAQAVRLIHYSTDCVFDGHKGAPYDEQDTPSAKDVYGLTKYLGELLQAPALTIRTSIIGHELRNHMSLLEWFLAQEGTVYGYEKAIYSGLPTSEQARILLEYVLPNPDLNGLYQVAGRPISKYELLKLVAEVYDKQINIIPSQAEGSNKTLAAGKFAKATGYKAPQWRQLVQDMRRQYRLQSKPTEAAAD